MPSVVKRAARAIERGTLWLPAYTRERLLIFLLAGYWPNIADPRTFNEKIAHRKLFDFDPRFELLADKWAVRDHVAAVIGAEYLTRTYGALSTLADLDLASLPERFVAKPSNASGDIYFVPDKQQLDIRLFLRTMNRWLRRRSYGRTKSEYWYKAIPPRIILEEWLADSDKSVPPDFKLFVFHGTVKVVQVDGGRFESHWRNFYTREWDEIPVRLKYPRQPGAPIEPPARLPQMIEAAEALGEPHDFVRVDLYHLEGGRIVFGELTFAPDGGRGRFVPPMWDEEFGKWW